MAVNHADGTMFISVPFFPIAAGIGAAHGGAGWLTIFFIPAGLAFGIGVCHFGRRIIYSITEFGMSRSSKIHKHWIQALVSAPFLPLYMILPCAISWSAIFATWAGSARIAKHIS